MLPALPGTGPAGRTRSVVLLLLLCAGTLRAQENSDCLLCHGEEDLVVERDGRKLSMYFDADRAAKSVHGKTECISCHVDLAGVKNFPHAKRLKPAECGDCHDESFDSIAAYWNSTHGRKQKAGEANAPRCQDCHGSHYIAKRGDPLSLLSPLRIPEMCTQCHADGKPVARAGALTRDEIAARYKDSIHGDGLFLQGLKVAAVCTSCHSGHGILPHTDPASTLHKDKVNDACRKCHNDEGAIHKGIVAQELWATPGAVPLCVDCHQPHGQRRIAYGTRMSDGECLACHTQPDIAQRTGRKALLVDKDALAHSVHGRNLVACAQCHSTPAKAEAGRTCAVAPAKVNCATCHDREVGQYQHGIHGSLHAKGEANAPTCVECHGTHTILESEVPANGAATPELRARILAGPTHRRNVPELCARCHKDGAPAAVRNPDGEPGKIEHYRESIHGKGLLESGLIASANCVDCHSAHMELPPSDPASSVSPERIVATCARCHDGIDEHFRHSIHSKEGNPGFRAEPGKPGLPHCNDCHSAHSVARTDLAGFKRDIVAQCGKCHGEITETYFDTYHGKVSALGSTVAARCHDCHGAHDILPASNPASFLHEHKVVATCGKCHAGSHERFAGYLTHATHNNPERYPALYWAFQAMTWLLLGVFGFFGLHLLAWLPRSFALRREHQRHAAAAATAGAGAARHYVRFTPFNRALHVMIIVSFLGLALTGMALKFAEAGWAKVLAALLGGTETAGWIHRVCAVITFAYMGLHLFDVARRFRASGKTPIEFFFGPDSMMPSWRDVKEFMGTARWFAGLGPRPKYGKWTYWEKFDYFAVFWGVIVIGFSGLVLWFPVFFTHFLPGWMINVCTIIHSEEALLATGFIFTIHFFNTHMRPEKFPMDRVVFTGRMTVEELKADKPGLYEELVASGELEKYLADPPTTTAQRAAAVFGFLALTIGVVVVVLIVHGLLTVGL
ncbi:MAG: hypothetical protein IT458_14405 [Planctomycetes bacterium]|nr:hypothetical protein [Planctomycetota bacterium]